MSMFTMDIDDNFYCVSACFVDDSTSNNQCCGSRPCYSACRNRHRKWPTPTELEEEYGREYQGDDAVYFSHNNNYNEETGKYDGLIWKDWKAMSYAEFLRIRSGYCEDIQDRYVAVCACTPFGKPPKDWRPQ